MDKTKKIFLVITYYVVLLISLHDTKKVNTIILFLVTDKDYKVLH